jgi:transposase
MLVGWDWATETHDVTVLDDAGAKVARWAPSHTEDGIAGTLARLHRLGEPADLPVAIEATRGLVVDRLLAAGHPVVPVHPNAFHAVRPRWGAAKAKTDAGDSFKLADYLRTDGRTLRRLEPTAAATLELQALARTRTDLVEAKVAAVNQLAALLDAHWPGAKALFANLDSAIALAFLERYPTPPAAAKLTAAKMAAFCKRHSYSGRRSAADLIERLRTAPAAASRIGNDTIADLIRIQTRLVRATLAAIGEMEGAIAEAVAEHPYATLFATMPRIGTVNLAQIIGEIGPMLERAHSAEQLVAEAGVVPVTRESGKHRDVLFRHATNHRARIAITVFADNSRHSSDWAAKIYNDARASGKRHPHATRILARAWLRVMWACWRDGTCYDPATHARDNKIKTTVDEPTAA